MTLNDFWAKSEPFQSIITHSVVSGRVAQELYDKFLSAGTQVQFETTLQMNGEEIRDFIGYLVSLHDIGKLELSFQAKNPTIKEIIDQSFCDDEVIAHGIRHEKTGEKCIRSIWQIYEEDRISSWTFSKIIGSHHQGKEGKARFRKASVWYDLQRELEEYMRKFFLSEYVHLPKFDHDQQGIVSVILLGIMIMADWISSGSFFSDAEEWIKSTNVDHLIRTKTLDFLRRSSIIPNEIIWASDFSGVWPNIPVNGLRPLQIEVERLFHENDAFYDILLIEAPMGEGKTEAGMYAALQMARAARKDGFYVALPTAATSNQMVFRIRDLLAMHGFSDRIRLLHSMAWLSDGEEINSSDEADEAVKWLAPTRRALLGQFAVGTIDQVMLAVTNIKYGVLRLLGLSNKVLLIDEVHSYDAYMNEIIVHLLRWCKALKIPVVMLSATLPPEAKARLLAPYTKTIQSTDYPVLTAVRTDGSIVEKKISGTSHRLNVSICLCNMLGNPTAIAAMAVEKVKEGGCLCVLLNTVREAQEVYQEIDKIYDGQLILFHSQFPAEKRNEIEKECIRIYGKDKQNRQERSILVATQVVEQSLDVDFDMMITAVAPIDLIIQRMGRIFRHEDTPRPSTVSYPSQWILIPEKEGDFAASSYVYPQCLLRRTIDILATMNEVHIPEDVATLVKKGYDSTLVPENELKDWIENLVKDQVEAATSHQYLINSPEKLFSPLDGMFQYEDDDECGYLSAKTRLGEPTVKIALLEEDELERLEKYLYEKKKKKHIRIKNKTLAKKKKKKSVSVRTERLGKGGDVSEYINGDGLLSGVRIYSSRDSICYLKNGRSICFDPKLGLLIKDGEK